MCHIESKESKSVNYWIKFFETVKFKTCCLITSEGHNHKELKSKWKCQPKEFNQKIDKQKTRSNLPKSQQLYRRGGVVIRPGEKKGITARRKNFWIFHRDQTSAFRKVFDQIMSLQLLWIRLKGITEVNWQRLKVKPSTNITLNSSNTNFLLDIGLYLKSSFQCIQRIHY